MKISHGQTTYKQFKLAKNLGRLYCAKHLVDNNSLKSIYISYIHLQLNYANIAWGSTNFTKLKVKLYQQKHAAPVVFHKSKISHSRPLLRSLNSFHVYQINLYQHVNFMYEFENQQTPKILRYYSETCPPILNSIFKVQVKHDKVFTKRYKIFSLYRGAKKL